jgi:hypothetical protein
MTNFVVNLATKYLKDHHESLVDHGCPQGLMAVILVVVSMYPLEALSPFSQITQLEHAAHAFGSGVLVKPSTFNHKYNRLFTLTSLATGTSFPKNAAFPKGARLRNAARALQWTYHLLK